MFAVALRHHPGVGAAARVPAVSGHPAVRHLRRHAAGARGGGDFYDFFLIGDACNAESGKLGFVVADVSGKGVPAALFMMAAKTTIRGYMESGMELGEAFENANRKLCAGNDSAMFVTAFAGVLGYATGSIAYVNAGHNAPFLRQHGEWRQLTDKSGLPPGLFDGMPYKAFECTCAIGDELLLYTDGVIEAMDVDDALYGLDRLKALLDDNLDLHPRELIELVRRDVTRFSEGAEQADDITMLALEFGVPPPRSRPRSPFPPTIASFRM